MINDLNISMSFVHFRFVLVLFIYFIYQISDIVHIDEIRDIGKIF